MKSVHNLTLSYCPTRKAEPFQRVIGDLIRMQEVPQDERAEMREEVDGGRGEEGGGGGRGTDEEPLLDKKTVIAGYTMAFIIVGK